MSREQLVNSGAFALYRAEQAHRVAEFSKETDGSELIRRDFEQFKGRYLRKFQDIVDCLAAEGLTVQKVA